MLGSETDPFRRGAQADHFVIDKGCAIKNKLLASTSGLET